MNRVPSTTAGQSIPDSPPPAYETVYPSDDTPPQTSNHDASTTPAPPTLNQPIDRLSAPRFSPAAAEMMRQYDTAHKNSNKPYQHRQSPGSATRVVNTGSSTTTVITTQPTAPQVIVVEGEPRTCENECGQICCYLCGACCVRITLEVCCTLLCAIICPR